MRASLLLQVGGLVMLLVAGQVAAEPCGGDTVSDAVCSVSDFLWGPNGVAQFAQATEAWAREMVQDVLP